MISGFRRSLFLGVAILALSSAPVLAADAKPSATSAKSVAAALPGAAASGQDTARADANGVVATLSLLPAEPVRLAAFIRQSHLWMVFDGWISPIPPQIAGVGASSVGAPERIELEDAVAYRFAVPADVRPIVRKDGLTWHVDLSRQPKDAKRPVFEPGSEGGEVTIGVPLDGPSKPLMVKDPLIGDEIIVIATEKPGEGGGLGRSLVDFETLATGQGLVLRPRNDALAVKRLPDRVVISAPKGLSASAAVLEPAVGSAVNAAKTEEGQIFQIARWRKEGQGAFLAKRREIEARAALADGPDLVRARLDLARLHFSHGFGREANGLIGLVVQQMPEFETSPDLRALRGAVRVMNFELDKAMEDLSVPALANQAEAALWRGLANAYRGDWRQAYEDFRNGRAILDAYPAELYGPMALARLEAALRQGNGKVAGAFIEEIEKREGLAPADLASLAYLKGEYKRQIGEPEEAVELWTGVAKSDDQLNRIKADLALIDLGVEDGKIEKKAAIEQLDGMRFAWRGDALELAILRKLGALQMESGAYRDGFTTLRYAAGLIAGSPLADTITAELSTRFNAIFVDDKASLDSISAVEAYALFQDFSELNPVGPAGDRAVERLADRLVGIDLLDKAAEVLERQVGFRLTGAEKGRVGAKLAGVRLLDNDPNGALKALAESEVPELTEAQKIERTLLRARAHSMLQKPDEALKLIASVTGDDAARLRADTLWRAQRWDQAAAAVRDLIGEVQAGQPASEDKARLIVDHAVALTLAGDRAALSQLQAKYGAAMTGSVEEAAFILLTGPEAMSGLPDLDTIRARIGAVDLFKRFMDSYRGAPPSDAKPVAAAASNDGSG
jgi:hypothetical protein